MESKKERILAVTGVALISLAFILTLLISVTQDRPSWPPTFSNLLAEDNSPQAKIFFSFGFLASILLLQSWILYLPPHNGCQAFRHISFCLGLIIVATIPTSNNKFKDFKTDDIWKFTLHMIGASLTFIVHPIYELFGTNEDLDKIINTYNIVTDRGRFRFCLAFTSLILTFIFVVLIIAQGSDKQTGMAAVSFTVECLLITLLLFDAWFILLKYKKIENASQNVV